MPAGDDLPGSRHAGCVVLFSSRSSTAYGFETIEQGKLTLSDDVKLEYTSMTKSLSASS